MKTASESESKRESDRKTAINKGKARSSEYQQGNTGTCLYYLSQCNLTLPISAIFSISSATGQYKKHSSQGHK